MVRAERGLRGYTEKCACGPCRKGVEGLYSNINVGAVLAERGLRG